MAYIIMAYIVMAYIVMAYIIMAYIVMAYPSTTAADGSSDPPAVDTSTGGFDTLFDGMFDTLFDAPAWGTL